MAGNSQGGGAPTQNVGQMANQAQQTNATSMGASSQYPGANMAAPGGSQLPNISPQTTSDIENLLQYYKQNAQSFAAGGAVDGYANGGMPQRPPMPQAAMANQQAQMARPQIMPQIANQQAIGNANAQAQVMPQRPPVMAQPQVMPQIANQQAALRAQAMPQAPVQQGPNIAPQRPPMDPRMAQNPGMTPNLGMMSRGMGQPVGTPMPGKSVVPPRPQVQGNPNATPISKALRPPGR